MALNPPEPGLRRIRHDSRSHDKVTLSVGPGEVFVVSDAVADQLTAASPQFKDAAPLTPPAATAGEPKKPAKKSTKKTSSAKR